MQTRPAVQLDPRAIAAALGGTARGNQISAPAPGHSKRDRSLRVLLDPTAPEGFIVHPLAGEDPIEMRDYVRTRAGLPDWEPEHAAKPQPTAHLRLVKKAEPPKAFSDWHLTSRGFSHVATYDYTSADGEVLFEVLRYEHPTQPKSFLQRRPDGDGGYLSGRGEPLLYRLHELATNTDDPVFAVEGEKDADRLASLGYLATTVPNGSWPEDLTALSGRKVYVLADNDAAGDKKAKTALQNLQGIAVVARIDLPGLPPKGDVSDWLDAGHTVEELESICSSAPPIAANDNDPLPAAPLSIFEWPVSRFVGEPPAVDYLVDGVIPLGVPGMVSAMGDTGKSFALLELHRRVAFGQGTFAPDVFGGKVTAIGTSVMITSEDDAGEVHRRISALDAKAERFGPAGQKMIVVPLPSAGGARAFWRDDKKKGLIETDDFLRICDQLRTINDLRLVTFDPLASFAHLALNEDPAAGQFVCTSLSRLATETGATVLVAHHMRKTQKPIENLGDARDAIRGSTALVDGLRLAYAMWPADEARAKRVCKSLGQEYVANKVVLGGVVKANGPAKRMVSTLVRNEFGLLIDRTSGIGAAAPAQDDLLGALIVAVEAAAASGHPFTRTGATGLYAMRDRLPTELRDVSRHRLEGLAATAIESGRIQLCLATGTTAKWLDVPGGQFAIGLGEFRKGAAR
ncbi:AAA family ATPase [Sinorhizobium numidicum]|uniref:AAA family ATPase n=1 Tax=Sinorhizobium numidicum TaxID=680248 RepID=A0ABY8D1K9_9HYPH|nr:AAA family ATPase [Sinorhizobium numidicum]WEX76908.1 AAA family ATPase [Sinorhizobium numidicum]WEX83567.1 AAA family ATPase [Sinorhizobium numidicum]